MNPIVSTAFNSLAEHAKTNLLQFGNYDIRRCNNFMHPHVDEGFGATLMVLAETYKSGKPMSRRNAQRALGKCESSNSSMFNALRAADLIKATPRGYIMTDTGAVYLLAWKSKIQEEAQKLEDVCNGLI